MSFDVFLQRFVGGAPAEVDREPVHAVLRTRQHSGPDSYGNYSVKFPDGVAVEPSARGLDGMAKFTGCAFFLRRMSPYLPGFILELATAGDMVVFSTGEAKAVILSSPQQKAHLPAEMARDGWESVVCGSPEELESLLFSDFVAWQRYRNQVISKSPRV